MCRIYDLKHVCCGCVHHSVNILPCRLMANDPPNPHSRIQRCPRGQTTIVECAYEGLPCCRKCYPGRRAWLQKRFQEFEDEIERFEKTGLFTTEEITRALGGGRGVWGWLVRGLETPRGGEGWDGCMDVVAFGVLLGGRRVDFVWE